MAVEVETMPIGGGTVLKDMLPFGVQPLIASLCARAGAHQ
jgi:hypothetical protein